MAYDGPSVVDFSQLRQSPFAGALDPITAAIDSVVARRHQAEMQRRQQEALDRRAAADDVLNREKFEAQRFDNNRTARAETEARVRAAIDAGEYDKAQAIASGYQEMGQGNQVARGLPGFSMKRSAPGPIPEAPPAPEAVPYGPQASPEDVRRATEIRSEQDRVGDDQSAIQAMNTEANRFAAARSAGEEEGPVPSVDDARKAALIRQEQASFEEPQIDDSAAQAEARDFASAQAGEHEQIGNQLIPAQYLETVAAHDNAMRMWRDRENAPPEVTVSGQRYDVQGHRKAQLRQRMQNAEDARAAFDGKMDPKYLELMSAGIATGTAPDKAFSATAGQMEKDEARAFRAQQDERNKAPWQEAEAGKTRRAIIGANSRVQAAGTARPAAPLPQDRLSDKYLGPINSQIKNIQDQFQLKTTRQELNNTEMVLNNSKDPVMQRSIAYNVIARGLAGEKGPLSKDDVTRISGQLGGTFGDIANWFSIHASGDMSDAQLQRVIPAIKAVIARNKANYEEAAKAYDKGLTNNRALQAVPGAADHIKARRAELFGEDKPAAAGNNSAVDDIMAKWKTRKAQ